MLVTLKGVSKSFNKKTVLSGIDLAIKDNEIFGLIGPSGSGKTTLIRLIIGALRADSGSIELAGYRIPDMRAFGAIGYMPQNDALYNDISGIDNLRFFGGMYHMKKKLLDKRINELLELVDLKDDGRKTVQFYSGGMKKRLSLAIAMLHSPKLLILDEPTVGIDPLIRKNIWDEFYTLKSSGTCILVTTHVMDEAVKCDRLALVYNGGIIACDTVDSLLAKTKSGMLEDLFFDSAAFNEGTENI